MAVLRLGCFTKVYGTVFLGEPRHLKGLDSSPVGLRMTTSPFMLIPMIVLGGLCLWIGLFPRTMAGVAFGGGAYLSHTDLSSLNMENIFLMLSFVVRGTRLH